MFNNWDTVYLNLTVHVTWISLSSFPNLTTLTEKYSRNLPAAELPQKENTETNLNSLQIISTNWHTYSLLREATATPAQALGRIRHKSHPSQRTTMQVSNPEAHQIKTHIENVNIEFSRWLPPSTAALPSSHGKVPCVSQKASAESGPSQTLRT